ncbi:MAG: M15 family metallopeptidase [Chloroflexota bacterium]
MSSPTRARTGRTLRVLAVVIGIGAAVAAWAPARVAAAGPFTAPGEAVAVRSPVSSSSVAAGVAAGVDPVPACTTADDPAPFATYADWASTLVDTRYRLARGYVPPGLVSTAIAGTNGGHLVRRLLVADLRALVAAARRDGVTIRVDSGYRSHARQAAVYAYYVRLLGPVDGALRAARPGHSEHQLGTALDIRNTAGAYTWIARSGWRYGFVVSYPRGARAVSCYRYEPWHVRYVGRVRAAAVHGSGLVERAWLWLHVVNRPA